MEQMKLSIQLRIILVALIFLVTTILAAQRMGKTNMDSATSEVEKLHQQDVAATTASNLDQLVGLWADDCVLIGQGDKPLVGKTAIRSSLREYFANNPNMKVLKYEPEVKSLQIAEDVAYEWGYFAATQQQSTASKPITIRARFLRVLKRQPDGSWKFARVMWNTEGQ
jgi:uncharacterized protein (TIGR02246 family)